MKKILFFAIFFYILLCNSLWAGFYFLDPDIPDGETITYIVKSEGKKETMVEKAVRKMLGGREIYEISSFSPAIDRWIQIDRNTMSLLSVHTVRKYNRVTLDTVLNVKDEKPNKNDDEITVADFSVLRYLFRGFPFSSSKKVRVGYYGEGKKKKFTFSVERKKKETIRLGQKAFACYRLEFGLEGFWGAFGSKLKLWYSVDAPHYLVRYEGAQGPPGTPKQVIELKDYTTKEQ